MDAMNLEQKHLDFILDRQDRLAIADTRMESLVRKKPRRLPQKFVDKLAMSRDQAHDAWDEIEADCDARILSIYKSKKYNSNNSVRPRL